MLILVACLTVLAPPIEVDMECAVCNTQYENTIIISGVYV